MKSNLTQQEIKDFYLEICKGDQEAFKFVCLWQTYCHDFDDLVDEDFSVQKLIVTNNNLTELLTCAFFKQYGSVILPLVYLSAEAYQASETTEKDSSLGLHLSHEGNNMLRLVSLIMGGYNHMVSMSKQIRILTYREHPLLDVDFKEEVKFNNLPIKD